MDQETISGINNKINEIQNVAIKGASNVLSALQRASAETGVNFAYLLNKAKQESSLNPEAKAATSSATGLFQFIEQTWLQMVREHGPRHGLGHLSAQIETRSDGSARVADATLRRQILDLRRDPSLSALMAGEMARDNQAHLQRAVGGKVGETELYLAHFLGAAGASQFLQALRDNPAARADAAAPAAARANRAVFYEDGRPRSLAAVYDFFAGKMGQPTSGAPAVSPPPARGWFGAVAAGAEPVPPRTLPVFNSTSPAEAIAAQPLSLFMVQALAAMQLPEMADTGSRSLNAFSRQREEDEPRLLDLNA